MRLIKLFGLSLFLLVLSACGSNIQSVDTGSSTFKSIYCRLQNEYQENISRQVDLNASFENDALYSLGMGVDIYNWMEDINEVLEPIKEKFDNMLTEFKATDNPTLNESVNIDSGYALSANFSADAQLIGFIDQVSEYTTVNASDITTLEETKTNLEAKGFVCEVNDF